MKPSILAAILTATFLLAPLAHAQTSPVPIGDPVTDTIQLWGTVAASIVSLTHDLTALFDGHKLAATNGGNKNHAPKELPSALTASAEPAVAPAQQSAASAAGTQPTSTEASSQQSRSPPAAEASSVVYLLPQTPAFDASDFITQASLSAQLQQLTNAFNAKSNTPSPITLQQNVAADGNAAVPYAAVSAINNLSGVTITNANLTASEIPALDYLSLSGGTLAGDLFINGSTTATNLSSQTFTASGTSTLANIILSGQNCSTYGNGGKLTTDSFGNVTCAADQSGGAGSTVAGSNGQIQFNGYGAFDASSAFTFASSTGTLTAPTLVSTNASATNATSTTLFSTVANFSNAVATIFNASVANIAGLTYANGTSTNATTTNLYAGSAVIPSLSATNATTTSLYISGITSKLLKTDANGQVTSATGGTDYEFPLTFSLPLTRTANTISIPQANASTNGFLASSDWTNFNGKLASSSLSAGTGISYSPSTGVIANTGVTSVAASGGSTGLTFTGSPITTTGTLALGGLLGVGFGGTGTSTSPAYGQLLVGNGSGGYALAATSTLGISSLSSFSASAPLSYNSGTGAFSISQANASTNGFLASSDWTNFNGKLASSSLATSALVAGLVSDHTGSGSLVFATSPTFAGTPVFSGGVINDSVNSTTTIPNGTPYAWTVATSTSATPVIEVDTSGSNGAVFIGGANSSGSSVELGAMGEPANLVFAASSTIEGAGTGQLITIGANSDVVDFGVNVGMGSTTPWAKLAVDTSNLSSGQPEFAVGSSTRTDLVINQGGWVGIGTSTPGSIFSINGVANWTAATSTYYSSGGINLTGGCFSIQGTCITAGGGPTYTFSYPLMNSGNTISEAWGTTTANAWSQLQSFASGFISNASSTIIGNATITGQTTLSNASSTNLTASGEGFFVTASTTNLYISGIASGSMQCLQINSAGLVTATGSGCGGSGSTPGGSNYQIQYNNSGAFGGSSNLVFTGTDVGIGTSTPWGELAVSANSGTTYPGNLLLDIASSTASATTTLFSVDNKGDVISTLAASSTFTVGANGTTNPAFQILASTTNAVTGLQLVSNLAGNGVNLYTTSTSSNERLTISSLGTGALSLVGSTVNLAGTGGGSTALTLTSGMISAMSMSNVSGNNIQLNFEIAGGNTNATANTEVPFFKLGTGQGIWHANGTIQLQRDDFFTANLHKSVSYAVSNNFTNLATIGVEGPPRTTANATTTNAFAILIGSSTPSVELDASTTNSYGLGVFASGGARNNYAAIFNGGNVGIGTTTPYSQLTVWGPDTASTSAFLVANNASTTEFNVLDNGNATLAGTLIQNSDQRLKTDIQSLDASSSLSLIDELNPVTFTWIDPNKGTTPQLGFIAQQLQPIFPNLVSTTSATALTPDGTLSLNYIDLISPIVSAIQALSADVTSIESTIAGFAESFTTDQLTFVRGQGTEIDVQTADIQTANVQTLCIGSTCVTETQLQALLAAAGQMGAADAGSDSSASDNTEASSTAPVIQINGNNPAIVQVGTTYNDLGASITGPQADLDLGIQSFVNGIETNPVQIDTSQAATDTIDYVVTDQNGLTSTSTRTVIVEAPQQDSDGTDNTGSSTPAASTTDVAPLGSDQTASTTTEDSATITTP